MWEIGLLVIWVQASSTGVGKVILGKVGDGWFKRGVGSSVFFYHEGRDVACVMHGDDFAFFEE